MSNIIKGEDLSCWKTIGITICRSEKANREGVQSRYIILTVKDKKSVLSSSKKVMMFEEDIPGVIDLLKGFAEQKTTTSGKKYAQVDLAKLKADDMGKPNGELYDFLEFPGGCVEEYVFRKGFCYGNDEAGKRIKDGKNRDVVRDRISVFVQVDYKEPTEKGFRTVYISGMSPSEIGSRLEDRFWETPVNPTASNTAQPEEKPEDNPTTMGVDDF